MFDCPICSHELLPHISHGQICWFCHYCWQDFPNLEEVSVEQPRKAVILQDPINAHRLQKRPELLGPLAV
ncbi:hypothetical protein [Acaryochloris marina]|uniref:Uncharacterized protein n=1 Tax=Acaryochloris marina (strain MBIC 11017) TaxID=329726 RepID=A8ZQP8_ACAM1|nr:hypothetical protein [Acaryochloris marina]ABW33334.1 conserved hypothetical protein [Acaryochloris marina MBIC11017]